jgi:hypothetical protein
MRIPVLIGALAALLAVGITPIAISDDKDGPYVAKDCVKPRVTPTRLILACGDGSFWINSINWKYWGNKQARGRGVSHLKTCRPDCATGGVKDYPVEFRLHKPRSRVCGGRRVPLFQKIELSWPAKDPPHSGDIARFYRDLFCVA